MDTAWLDRFADVTRAEILRWWRPNSCIVSTRLGLEVLKYFGVGAAAQAVTVAAFTKAAAAAIIAGENPRDFGHSVGIAGTDEITMQPDGRRSWDGHLVIRLTQQPVLIDLSADQLDRPQRGLRVPQPIIAPIDDTTAFERGRSLVLESAEDGTVLFYTALTSRAWRKSSDWTKHQDQVRRSAATVINTLR